MAEMAFCDLANNFHNYITNGSLQAFVILLLGFLTFPICICLINMSMDSTMEIHPFMASGALSGDFPCTECLLLDRNVSLQF